MGEQHNRDKGAKETGIVKWFDESKGYGFIERPNGRDLFVYYKEIRGKLQQGDEVEYEIGEARQSPCALGVRVIKRAKQPE